MDQMSPIINKKFDPDNKQKFDYDTFVENAATLGALLCDAPAEIINLFHQFIVNHRIAQDKAEAKMYHLFSKSGLLSV